jgi:predicted RNA-binding protein YlxR (DUF448 family)
VKAGARLRPKIPRRRLATLGTTDHISEDGSEAEEPEAGPLRRCAVTREQAPKERLVRFVVAPAGPDGKRQVVPDLTNRLPGRGIWLSARRDVLDSPRARGAFARAARGPVAVPPDLAAAVEAGLRRRIVELLGLTRRAGQAVCGFQKAREWVVAHKVGLVVQAMDGSEAERARLLSGAGNLPVAAPFGGEMLGAAFGRDWVVHVAVAPGRLAGLLRIEIGRLQGITEKVFEDDPLGPAKG